MLEYKIEKGSDEFADNSLSTAFCEICSKESVLLVSINEYHKDGTIKIHNGCSRHFIELYNKVTKEAKNK